MKAYFKKSLAVLLSAMLLLASIPFAATAAEVAPQEQSVGASSGTTGDCTWTLDDEGTLTITGNGAMANYTYSNKSPWGANIKTVVIEDGVTSIGSFAFYGCTGLTSVTIPDSVTSIGSSAFSGCTGLTSVHISDIAAWCNIAFSGYDSNPLYYAHDLYLNDILVTDLIIPDSVTSIGSWTFCGCTGLTSVAIPDSVTSIGDDAFEYTAWYNNQPDGLIYAGKVAYTYKGTMLANTSITLQDGTKGIADRAFSGCTGLTSITIPDSVTSIGYYAFDGCTGLTSVHISDIAAWCNITFSDSTSNPLVYAQNIYLNDMFVTDLIIPDGVTSIGDSAFFGCNGLTSVTIPDSVTSIGSQAFAGCNGLTSVHISDIAAWCNIAFSGYDSNPLYYAHDLYLNDILVTDLIIPDSVTSIGSYAFYGCTGLTSMVIPDSVTSIGSWTFSGCTGLTSVTIPDSVTIIGRYAFGRANADLTIYGNTGTAAETYCKNEGVRFRALYEYTVLPDDSLLLTKCYMTDRQMVIPSSIGGKSVSQLGNWLFLNNSVIESITIPDSVTSIGKGAFYSCVELKTVTMGNNVTEIGDSAFEKCLFLEEINLSSQLKTIGDEAFFDCRRLKQLNIPNTVTSIGEEAFTNCRSLQSLIIPQGVQKLGDESSVGFGMFENCKSLKEITVPASVGAIQSNAFDGCNQVKIFGKAGSYIQQFAAEHNLKFSAAIIESVGDACRDGRLTVRDVTAIQRHLAGFDILTGERLDLADTNGDGKVTINDATLLQMFLAEYDVQLG